MGLLACLAAVSRYFTLCAGERAFIETLATCAATDERHGENKKTAESTTLRRQCMSEICAVKQKLFKEGGQNMERVCVE